MKEVAILCEKLPSIKILNPKLFTSTAYLNNIFNKPIICSKLIKLVLTLEEINEIQDKQTKTTLQIKPEKIFITKSMTLVKPLLDENLFPNLKKLSLLMEPD